MEGWRSALESMNVRIRDGKTGRFAPAWKAKRWPKRFKVERVGIAQRVKDRAWQIVGDYLRESKSGRYLLPVLAREKMTVAHIERKEYMVEWKEAEVGPGSFASFSWMVNVASNDIVDMRGSVR